MDTMKLLSMRLVVMVLYPVTKYVDGIKLLNRFDVAVLIERLEPFKAVVRLDVVSPIVDVKV